MFLLFLAVPALSYVPSDAEIDKLISTLSLTEKVGQMTQIAIDDFVNTLTDTVRADYAAKAINQYQIGSILNTYGGVCHKNSVWASIQKSLDSYAKKNPSGIPLLYGLDSIHGATYVTNATLFPQEIGIAATFNTTIAEVGSRVSAYETRSASVPWVFSPVLDLGLDPRWSRMWEDFGEDPYLSSQMGAAMVRGFQGSDPYAIDTEHVAACAKHYLGYGNPVSGKDRTPAVIPENYLREYHLPSFQAAVEAKVATVMVNSGLINGISVHASHFLLTDLLKNELGFDGLVVTDWGDIEAIHARDHIAETSKEAVGIAINAGIDMAMVPYSLSFADYLTELVQEGTVPISRINDAVKRILKVKARLGLWQHPITETASYPKFGSKEFERESYEAAAESITLLKNSNNILPLAAGAKVLVTGPNANSMRVLNGGWSYSWQGEAAGRYTAQYNTVLKAIQNVHGASNVLYAAGVGYSATGKYWEDSDVGIAAAADLAKSVDVVILVVGENSYTEKPGDLQDLSLSDNQLKLARAVIDSGKPVVLVLSEGRPRIINKFVDEVKAVLQLYLPGNFGGDALADILFGKVNPSGRLPYNYPRYPHSLVNYWHKLAEEQTATPGAYNYESDYSPLWEFGTGLSYTTFQYSALTLSSTTMKAGDNLTVSVTVKNTGTKAGKEAVLLYTSDLYASTAPDARRLRKFTKIDLAAGASQVVTFRLTANDLSFINTANKRITEPGEFRIKIGSLTQTFRFQK